MIPEYKFISIKVKLSLNLKYSMVLLRHVHSGGNFPTGTSGSSKTPPPQPPVTPGQENNNNPQNPPRNAVEGLTQSRANDEIQQNPMIRLDNPKEVGDDPKHYHKTPSNPYVNTSELNKPIMPPSQKDWIDRVRSKSNNTDNFGSGSSNTTSTTTSSTTTNERDSLITQFTKDTIGTFLSSANTNQNVTAPKTELLKEFKDKAKNLEDSSKTSLNENTSIDTSPNKKPSDFKTPYVPSTLTPQANTSYAIPESMASKNTDLNTPTPLSKKTQVLEEIKQEGQSLNQNTTEHSISDNDLIAKLVDNKLLKKDDHPNDVNFLAKGSKETINIGSQKSYDTRVKVSQIGSTYLKMAHEQNSPPRVFSPTPFQPGPNCELNLGVLIPDNPQDTFLYNTKQMHMVVVIDKDSGKYYCIGFLTSQNIPDGKLSDTQFKDFYNHDDFKKSIKIQYLRRFENAEEISKDKVKLIEKGNRYLGEIQKEPGNVLTIAEQNLKDKPVVVVNKIEGYSKKDAIKAVELCERDRKNNINPPKTQLQKDKEDEAHRKQREKNQKKQEEKYNNKKPNETEHK